MNRRGDIWVSAAIYVGLGIVLVTLILAAGIPLINKIQTKNTVLQTKEVMFKFDRLIRDVYLEGLGSQRPFFIDIKDGEFLIDRNNENKIEWIIDAKDNLGIEPDLCSDIRSQSCKLIEEGNLKMKADTAEDGFRITIFLDFNSLVDIRSGLPSLTKENLVVEHKQDESGGHYVEIREV
jgi:hypothetical protein